MWINFMATPGTMLQDLRRHLCLVDTILLRPPVPVLWLRSDIFPPPLIPDFGRMSLKFRVLPYDFQAFVEILQGYARRLVQ